MEENTQAANTEISVGIANPIKINLQLFGEGEPTPEPTPEPSPEPTPSPTPEPTPEPDVTKTQAFAHRLKEETAKHQERQDKFAQKYGYQTFDEMEQAEEQRRQAEEAAKFKEQNGFDPDSVKPLFEQWKKSDPDFQELSQIRQEKNISAALTDLNNELKDCGIDLQLKDLSDAEIQKLPNVDKITELVSRGRTLAEAFFYANKKDIITRQTQAAQQEAVKKIVANGASSPGSLSSGTDNEPTYTMDQINAMSQAEINKNYTAVMASIKRMKG